MPKHTFTVTPRRNNLGCCCSGCFCTFGDKSVVDNVVEDNKVLLLINATLLLLILL